MNRLNRTEGFRAAELALTGDRLQVCEAFEIDEAELDYWIGEYVR